MKLPFIQFYPADYLRDTRALSCAAKGGWVDILCMLHGASPRGSMSLPMIGWARIMGASVDQAESIIEELEHAYVANVDHLENNMVKITSRRMLAEFTDKQKNAERQQRFRAKGGGDPERWTAIRVNILERDKYVCAYCGRKARTVDHIVPRCQGGDEKPSNLVAACYRCNQSKNGRTPEEAQMAFWKGFDKSVLESNAESNAEKTSQKSDTRNQKTETRTKDISAAPSLEGLADDAAETALMVFPCVGKQTTWGLTQRFVDELRKLYPTIDPLTECELARSKIANGAVTKKTAKGMPKFLFSWMDRASNHSRGAGTSATKPARRMNFA